MKNWAQGAILVYKEEFEQCSDKGIWTADAVAIPVILGYKDNSLRNIKINQ